jgi:hypothetical protein
MPRWVFLLLIFLAGVWLSPQVKGLIGKGKSAS